jgi:hypothetical protein
MSSISFICPFCSINHICPVLRDPAASPFPSPNLAAVSLTATVAMHPAGLSPYLPMLLQKHLAHSSGHQISTELWHMLRSGSGGGSFNKQLLRITKEGGGWFHATVHAYSEGCCSEWAILVGLHYGDVVPWTNVCTHLLLC